MKTLLISPPWHALMNRKRHDIHLGLASITGVLRADGHDVMILDGESVMFSMLPEGEAPDDLFSHDTTVYVERQNSSHPIWSEFANIVLSYSPDIVGISLRNIDNQLRMAPFYYYRDKDKKEIALNFEKG